MTFNLWLRDTAEKAVSQLVQAAIVFVIAAEAVDEAFYQGLAVAVVIAVATVLRQAFTSWMPTPSSWFWDMVVRTFWTFAASIAGAAASLTFLDLIDLSWWKAAAASAGVAALAVIKAALAARKPATISPASFAKAA